MRLIDADALKDRMHELFFDGDEIERLYKLLGIDSAIDTQPTVMLKPETHESSFSEMYIDRSRN